jgi:hypothetical protein
MSPRRDAPGPQGLFPDRQRTPVKRLSVGITTTLVQVNASIVEQSRSLRKREAPLDDKFRASVCLGKKPDSQNR